MLPPFDAILFDFDGTLAVQNLDFDEMGRRVFAFALQHDVPSQELQGLYILEMIAHATALLQQRHPPGALAFANSVEQLLQDMEVEAAHSSGLLPGIEELLIALQQRQIGVGIVTRNCTAAVRVMFPHVDVYCQALFPRDRVKQVKPHPAHLQEALAALVAAPSRALMVGDGAMDMQAGKSLGMFCIGVLSGSSTRERLLAYGADLVLDSAADLLPYLVLSGEVAS